MKGTFRFGKNDVTVILIWFLIIFSTWVFLDGANHFLTLTPEALGKYFDHRWVLIAHITGGGGALILGFIQFWPKLRTYNWKLHRVIGILYLLAILLSSVCAVFLAFTTAFEVNLAYAFSLQVWVSVWISATVLAYYAALKRNWTLHRRWMTRSYIVTIAFLISGLLLKVPFVQSLGNFEDISPSLFWFGWSVPLYIYEFVLAYKPLLQTKSG